MKKELTIQAKFDTSDFDKSVESMQKKLKEIYAPADMIRAQSQTAKNLQNAGFGGIVSKPGQDDFAKSTQSARRELDALIREQAKGQEQLGKLLIQRNETLEKLKKQQQEAIVGSTKELELKKQIGIIEENNARMRDGYQAKAQALNMALNTRANPPGMPPYPTGVYQGPANTKVNGGYAGIGGAWAGLISGVGGAIGAAGIAAERFTGYGQRLEAARGSAVENGSGRDLRDVYSGRSAFEGAYKPEREQAAGLAETKAGRNRVTDRMKGVGSAALVVGGGIMAATGAGLLPGLTMMGTGIAGLSNDRSRQGIFGGQEYDQLIAAQQSADFRENYDNLKNQDPSKKLALENFEQNRHKDVAMQRALGLNDKKFYEEGGFQQKATKAGFVPDQAMGMASSILGAGGSSRMGNNAVFGLQMERSGLTNAGGVLGSLSGSIQSPEATKRATISIMAEAFKIGLDDTDFAEENRKFTQAAANIISRSGATNEGDQDKITQTLGMFLAERTNKGVESAQGAYEKYQERGSQLGGRRGAMRFMAARQNEHFKDFSTAELTELLGSNPEDIREDSAGMRAFQKMGKFNSFSEMKDTLGGINKQSRFLNPNIRDQAGKNSDIVQAYMNKTGKTRAEINAMSRTPGLLPDDVETAYGKTQIFGNVEENGKFNASTVEAQIGDIFGEGDLLKKQIGKSEAGNKLENRGDRLSDKITGSAAEGAEEARKAFVDLTKTLGDLTINAREFTGAVAPTGQALSEAAKTRQSEMGKSSGVNVGIYGPILQQQAGKPKGP